MEQITKTYKEYMLKDVIADISALLNTDGGSIYIHHSPQNDNHLKIESTIKGMLGGCFYTVNLSSSNYYYSKEVDISEYVTICKDKMHRHFVTAILVKPFIHDQGMIIFNGESPIYYFAHNKRIKLECNGFSDPFIHQLLRDKKWTFPHAYENSLYEFLSYTPHLSEIKKAKHISAYWLDELQHIEYVYKYMSLDAALASLNSSKLRFCQPSLWKDQYEKRFYNANYYPKDTTVTPKLYANCFTSKQDNEPSWYIYSQNSQRSGSRIVEFKLNFKKLFEQLILNLNECALYIGLVKYLKRNVIDDLHEPIVTTESEAFCNTCRIDNPYYYHYFKAFSKENYLHLLLLKRDAFEHEQEIRFFIVPNSQESIESDILFVDNFNWIDLIEQVRIDERCSVNGQKRLESALKKLYKQKKKNVLSGCKNYKSIQEQRDFLSSSFVYSPWEDQISIENGMAPELRVLRFFDGLKNKIKPIVYDIYSADLSGEPLTINTKE